MKRKPITDQIEHFIKSQHGSAGWEQKLVNLFHRLLDEHRWESYCGGCGDPHNSFWKSMVISEEWKEWETANEMTKEFDVIESRECGWISPEHFEAFIKFIKK